jgi:hypothetical protein
MAWGRIPRAMSFWEWMFMRLDALSSGYAVPYTDFDATIHSVFSAAVNLSPANHDLLLTLVIASETDLPQGLRLDTPPGFSFEDLEVGSSIHSREGTLVFDRSNLVVDFCQARRWQCDLPAMRIDMTCSKVAETWISIWQALNERQAYLGADIVARALLHSDGMAQSTVSRRAGEAIRLLIDATRRYQLDQSALAQLIGLGTGLTPGGDDFLVGYLAGLWCTVRDSLERRRFVSKLSQAVIHLSGQTNDISRTYLYHAAHGQVSSRLEALARAISKPQSPGQLLTVAESAMQSGHTSGTDAVTGLLFGLAAWEIGSGRLN